jgi:RNA recognition motif-containing protein
MCTCLLCFVSAVNVYLPKDRVTNNHQGYGFVEFRAEEDADYVSVGQHSS